VTELRKLERYRTGFKFQKKDQGEEEMFFFFWKTSDSDTNFQFDQFLRWSLVFGLLCRHTVSTPITVGTHTSGAQ